MCVCPCYARNATISEPSIVTKDSHDKPKPAYTGKNKICVAKLLGGQQESVSIQQLNKLKMLGFDIYPSGKGENMFDLSVYELSVVKLVTRRTGLVGK